MLQQHTWCSGTIQAFHACDMGSMPSVCMIGVGQSEGMWEGNSVRQGSNSKGGVNEVKDFQFVAESH